MKSHEFITEAEVTPYAFKVLTLDDTKKALSQHCRYAPRISETPLWRGIGNHNEPFLFIDPSTGVRKSENTTNHYTELMDNSPYFEGWPKRSKSLICSTSQGTAASFRIDTYAIFPVTGSKIAICPYHDLWDTTVDISKLSKIFDNMSQFNRFLKIDLGMPGSYRVMQQYVNTSEFEENLLRCQSLTGDDTLSPEDVIPYLHQALSPAKTGFKLINIEDYHPVNDKEVWTDGAVIAIRKDKYYRYCNQLLPDSRQTTESVDHHMRKKK